MKKIIGLISNLTVWLVVLLPLLLQAGEARMEVLHFDSSVLKNNPLHDPSVRNVAIFVPSQATNQTPLPIVYYLPGFGGSSQGFINGSNAWMKITQEIADEIQPVILAVPDGRTRWACSQYLNSPAQGNYEDYICDEIRQKVETLHPAPTNGIRRIIAGHSSGGFGALRLGMSRQKLFDAVIALSPDSDFPVSHWPLVAIPAVTNVPLAQISRYENLEIPAPRNGDLIYALALSAAYAPRGDDFPGQIDWLCDAQGKIRPEIWQRWLDNDPLTIVRKDKNAFAANQLVYLDGAAHDQFSANIGARKIYETLNARSALRCTFYEPPGRHGDHVPARLERGLAWIFGRPLQDIK